MRQFYVRRVKRIRNWIREYPSFVLYHAVLWCVVGICSHSLWGSYLGSRLVMSGRFTTSNNSLMFLCLSLLFSPSLEKRLPRPLVLFTISFQLVSSIFLPYCRFLSCQRNFVLYCSSLFHIENIFCSNYLTVSSEQNCCSIAYNVIL
jgi:hypothetical protein